MRRLIPLLIATLALLQVSIATPDPYARIDAALAWADSARGLVYRDEVAPRWLPDGTRFWYEVRTGPAENAREFVLVDATTGDIHRAPSLDALGLPPAADTPTSGLPARDRVGRTRRTGSATRLVFINPGSAPVRLFWIDESGERQPYGEIAPGQSLERSTYEGHRWLLESASGETLAILDADAARPRILIDGPANGPAPARDSRPRGEARSPDGRWEIRLDAHNVHLVRLADGASVPLTTDGSESHPYVGPAFWSPDSRAFMLTRVERVPVRQITLVESAPRDQLQPKSRQIDYIKPGDPLPDPTPILVNLPAAFAASDASTSLSADAVSVRAIDRALCRTFFTTDGWIGYRWSADAREVFLDYNQRGHQLYRILAIDAATAAVRTVVEERAEAFVDYTNKTWRHWLPGDRELLWISERDGFAHLWLFDTTATNGAPPRQLTRGPWVVRRVEHVDAERRQIWFWAGGVRPGESPYHLHLCRVNLDGTGFVRLTEGDGTHRVAWSPDRRWFVDTFSRVDLPPVTELRRAEDGALVAALEKADASALLAAGWQAPGRFTAPGRDGATPIYGVIFRPPGFNPTKRYPVIEEVYAGPHDAFSPVGFGTYARQQSFARLGFIVVQSDGMGTNHRGRAFHSGAWKNLQDAGFPDRIAWIKAAAAKRPWMDLSRVGITGGSAGGQTAMRALLDHANFYSAAVADCGCHDNRMDKIWWNEQWLGWPLDESYVAASNVEHAARLRGHLLLIVGEQDTNVDPASTLQVVDALARANRPFEFLLLPGAGHGAAETPYGKRRRAEFLLRHLAPPSDS